MTVFWKNHKATERVRCIYLDPTNRKKLMTPVVKIEKGRKKFRRKVTL